PEPASLGFAGAWRGKRYRRVVDMQGVSANHLAGERVDQRFESCRRCPDPAGQSRVLQVLALAVEDLGLSVERQMIVVLRDDDMGQQPRPGAPASNRVIWRRRRDDGVAGP